MQEANPLIKVEYLAISGLEESKVVEKNLNLLSAKDFSPGTRISRLQTFETLEAFMRRMAVVLTNTNTPQATPNAFYFRRERVLSVREDFRRQVQTRHFYGQLKNFSALMLMPDMIPNVPRIRSDVQENASFAFLLDGEMHSTGRGIVGHARRVYGMYLSTNEAMDFFLSNGTQIYAAREILTASRQFDSSSFKRDVEALITDSRLSSQVYLASALSRIVSGGLPSLGKR